MGESHCPSTGPEIDMQETKQKPQRFTVSHLREEDFKSGGLRDYSAYRDLGIASATHGLATAHVIRMTAPFTEELSKRHHHNVAFQMVYVLKGWFKNEFEGEGVHVMRAGSCWIQPPGIRHTVLGWSDDCELLEIILPAEHETVSDP
jgi:mannose-6-phosphate isomerase-like protein (cupin superfamily)